MFKIGEQLFKFLQLQQRWLFLYANDDEYELYSMLINYSTAMR